MKKLLTVLFLFAISFAMFGQKPSIWKPVPKNLFTKEITIDRTIQGQWLWRFSAAITATELQWQKDTKQFVSAPLSSVGPAIGYKHFTSLEDGTPYCDWGISGALLLGTDLSQVDPAQMKVALLVNALQYINVGGCYTINGANHWGILLGASINF